MPLPSTPIDKLIGTVVRAGLQPKTIHVSVPFQEMHHPTRKMITINKMFLSHDQDNSCKVGNVVRIEKGPKGPRKQHKVVEKLAEKAPGFTPRISTRWHDLPRSEVEKILAQDELQPRSAREFYASKLPLPQLFPTPAQRRTSKDKSKRKN